MKKLKKVFHINQNTMEYYRFDSLHGWVQVSPYTAGDWKPGTFDYIELRHSMPLTNGIYGPYVME